MATFQRTRRKQTGLELAAPASLSGLLQVLDCSLDDLLTLPLGRVQPRLT